MADKAIWQSALQDDAGNIITDALVEVRTDPGGDLVVLKPNRDGTGTKANPFAAPDGFAVFYTDPGEYKITVTSATAGTRTYRYVVLQVLANATQAGTSYLSSNIASGTVQDFDAAGNLDADVGVLDLNPSAGNTDLASLTWDAFPDGAEVLVTNVHASNLLTIKNTGSPTTGRAFRAYADVALLQNMSVKVKKSVGADKWLVLP